MNRDPYDVTISSSTIQSSSSADLLYTAMVLTIPEDGVWRLYGSAGMTSNGVSDAKVLELAINGVVDVQSSGAMGDGAIGTFFPYSTTPIVRRLKKGTIIQLYGQRNGGSGIQMGASISLVTSRITAERVA